MSAQKPEPSAFQEAMKDIVGGTIGGIGITLVGHPFDTLKVRLQTQSATNPIYSGLGDCVRKTYQSEGFPGFYKGVMSPLTGQMFFNAIQFLAYGQAKTLVAGDLPKGQDMTIPQYFAAGGITGGIVAFVEGPIDLFKTQLQVQVFQERPLFTSFFGTVRYITSNYGFKGWFQGVTPTVLRNTPAVSFYFGAYEMAKIKFCDPGQKVEELQTWKLLTAGAIGGFAYWSFTFPMDVIKSAMQADDVNPAKRRFTGVADCAAKLWKEGGITRFYRGFAPCLLRAAPANATCFFLYEKTKELMG